jgi:hypothetical protein
MGSFLCSCLFGIIHEGDKVANCFRFGPYLSDEMGISLRLRWRAVLEVAGIRNFALQQLKRKVERSIESFWRLKRDSAK